MLFRSWADRTEVFTDVKRMMDSVASKLHALTVENETVQKVVEHVAAEEAAQHGKKRRRRRNVDDQFA